MAKLIRRAKKALAERYKKAKNLGYWNDSHIDQGFCRSPTAHREAETAKAHRG